MRRVAARLGTGAASLYRYLESREDLLDLMVDATGAEYVFTAPTGDWLGDLLDIGVQKGARIERGQAVGTAGPIPSGSDGIYFELRVDAHPADPLQWLKKR